MSNKNSPYPRNLVSVARFVSISRFVYPKIAGRIYINSLLFAFVAWLFWTVVKHYNFYYISVRDQYRFLIRRNNKMKRIFFEKSLFLALSLAMIAACGTENAAVQAGDSDTESEALADIVEMDDGNFLVEGDMILSPEQTSSSGVLKKSGAQSALLSSTAPQWGANAIIEYYFVPANASQNLTSMNARAKRDFARALKDISNGVAVSFKQVSSPSTNTVYVYTYTGEIPNCSGADGCATVGKVSSSGNTNTLRFTASSSHSESLVYRTFFHEMCHVLGFMHEHQRADRDSYVTVSSTDATNDGITSGDYLGTSFDMASIMLYHTVTPINDIPVYLWRGVLPLQSYSDQSARRSLFGSETATKNTYYIKHSSGKYLCRSGTGSNASITLNTTTSDLCIWDITSGGLGLMATSATSGIVLDHSYASTIRSTETTYQGFGIYFSYSNTTQQFSLSVQGAGIRYASKWIPMSNGNESLHIWNPLGFCLGLNSANTAVAAYSCPEAYVRSAGSTTPVMVSISDPRVHWELYPTWNVNSAY